MRSLGQEKRIHSRFLDLLKGDVTAGRFLQKLGGKLMGLVETADHAGKLLTGTLSGGIQSLSVYRTLMRRELQGLARGVLDRNVGVDCSVRGKICREWLEKEQDGGNYTQVTHEEAALVQLASLKYESAI
ncbi:hypothetical protein CYMTET_19909 [Cymbomonas tetramitiformis]|uniref:Uncharacterized protein n=1 Tax=Cymbomonas tetramitiformis TaxID=36881 RepID=A0AAE0G541_9CHLO|nr:hypothetical protein CYMTET_19909 [Cymbomonas tetramitiformis]